MAQAQCKVVLRIRNVRKIKVNCFPEYPSYIQVTDTYG